MNRTQLPDQSCLSGSTGRPAVTRIPRLGAALLACLVFLAGVATAAGSNASSEAAAPGIRDPMNPQAYMNDLERRMNASEKRVFLSGPAQSKTSVTVPPRNAPVVPARTNSPASTPVVRSGTPIVPPAGASPVIVPASQNAAPGTAVIPPAQAAPGTTPAPAPNAALQTQKPAANAAERIPDGTLLPGQTSASPVEPTPQVPPSQTPESPMSTPIGSSLPTLLPSSTPAGTSMPLVTPASAITRPAVAAPAKAPAINTSLVRMEPGMAPIRATQAIGIAPLSRGPGSVEKGILAASTGLTLWNEQDMAKEAAREEAARARELQARAQAKVRAKTPAPEPKEPWTLAGDLEKYRAHAVKDGARNSGESLKKALARAGLALGDTADVFVLGYASDRTKAFRANDGKGLLDEPGKVPVQAGKTIANFGYALYAILDLATVNSLPDANTPAYKDNNVLVRPLIYTGRTIGGVWKTTEEIGNAVTWGLFDNVTGCVGLVIEDVVEFIKHTGEAVTNVVRAPFHLAAGKNDHEVSDKTLDWVLLVPLQLASSAVEMKGISNMEGYENAFKEKGVIGSVLEFGGSTYIVYRAVDQAVDKWQKDHTSNHVKGRRQSQSQNQSGQNGSNSGNSGSNGNNSGSTDTGTTGDTTPSNGDLWWFYDPTTGTFTSGYE